MLESASTLISTQSKSVSILKNMKLTKNIRVSLISSGTKPKLARKRTTNEEGKYFKLNEKRHVVRPMLLKPRREPKFKHVKPNVMNAPNNAMKRRRHLPKRELIENYKRKQLKRLLKLRLQRL